MMRKMIFAALIALLPLTLPAAGEARDGHGDHGRNWGRGHDRDWNRGWDRHSHNHWRGGSSVFISSGPAYYDYPVAYDYVPAPIYYAPAPAYYAPRPVYIAPRPVYRPSSFSFGMNLW